MKKILHYAIFLSVTSFIVTLIAFIGFYGTKDRIKANRDEKITENIALLFSADEGYVKNDEQPLNAYRQDNYDMILDIYEVLDSNGNIHALIYDVKAPGRNGDIYALVAVDPYENKVVDMTYYSHVETPGRGELYTIDPYLSNMLNQEVTDVELDLIAGATTTWIGIRAFLDEITDHYEREVNIGG